MQLPLGEIETLTRVLSMVAGLAALGWALLGMSLNISRTATLSFCAANLLVVGGEIASQFRGPDVSLFDFYHSPSASVVMFLGVSLLFRSGMQELHGVHCRFWRDALLTCVLVLLVWICGEVIGLRSPAMVAVFLTAGGLCLLGFYEAGRHLRKTIGRVTSVLLTGPFAAVGALFILRVFDQTIGPPSPNAALQANNLSIKFELWTQIVVFLLINASLIGQTLYALFKKINDQARRLQTILDTAPVGVAVSTGGTIRYANPRLTELLDIKTGDPASNALVTPQTRDRIVAELKAHGAVTNMEIQMYCPRHTVRDLLVTYLPTDYEGRPGVLGWMIDITERKRSEVEIRQANDEQGAIFESATMGIAFIKEWQIVRANHRLAELFGWELAEILGQSPRIWYPDAVAMGEGPYEDIKRGEIHNSTQQLVRKDGSLFWCRLSGSAIDPHDLNRGTVWMFDDVTAERRASELMRKAKELAEDATRMKSDFLANMSHEIRTPMNAIIGMAHLALQTDLNARQRNYIEKVDSAGRNLLGIINDILDFSKIEAGKLRFELTEFHLEDVMETLADVSILKAQDKGLELLFDIGAEVPTSLVGDPLRLGQVLINLVGNAIKFTERGEITVGIHVLDDATTSDTEVRLRFDVSDTGVGLSGEQREKLFSAFSQADASTTRKYGGTGLGLTISKRLVELMDGHIDVQSQQGAGSTFTFTARFALQMHQHSRGQVDVADAQDLRILMVDDNARAREIMLAILVSQKFDAVAVASGSEAMVALESAQDCGRPFGLVLMDWMMPEMDGLATVQRIRAEARFSSIPTLVMVTAHSREEFVEQADGTRIDGLLLKPVNPSTLLDSILCVLGKEVVSTGRRKQRREANQDALQAVRGAHILLVEDNLVNQELALEILQGAGIQVDVASNGAEAVAKVARAPYDGVLMDCQMPVMDGFQATRLIRSDNRFADLPILAMTANAMSGDRELCLAAGMNDHIGKPIDVDQLFVTLARWVRPKNPDSAGLTSFEAAMAPQESDLPAVVGLNLVQASRRMGGNNRLMRKLVNRFAQTQADAMARIHRAIADGDWETARRDAHTTKGLAGNIGATELMALAGAVEGALKLGPGDALQSALAAMEHELNVVLANIAAALVEANAGVVPVTQSVEVDRVLLASELGELATLLADDDSRAARMVDNLIDKLRACGQGVLGSQLQKLVAKYEYQDALQTLHETAQALDIALH